MLLIDGDGILPPPARGRGPLEEWEGAIGIYNNMTGLK